MGIGCTRCGALLFLALFLIPFPILVTAKPYGYMTVNSFTSWTSNFSDFDYVQFDDGSIVRIIDFVSNNSYGPKYGDAADPEYRCGCGFFCNQTCDNYLFVIFTFQYRDNYFARNFPPQVAWSANLKNPVSVNATLELTSERGLVLKDANGTTVWSTNISNKSVAALNLTDMCNLKLLDENNATIWQSFDHPPNTLVVGHKMVPGQQLTSQGGLFSLSLTSEGLFAYINTNPPQRYFYYYVPYTTKIRYVQFQNGSLAFSLVDPSFNNPYDELPRPSVLSSQYMRVGPDGHLRMYDRNWIEVYDVFKEYVHYCGYPTVCGNYGICINDQNCSCPGPKNGTSYFQPINDRELHLGCVRIMFSYFLFLVKGFYVISYS